MASFLQTVLYVGLLSVRFMNLPSPQPGYIHPDEYFQTIDVTFTRHYSSQHGNKSDLLAWDLRNEGRPLRSPTAMAPFIDVPVILYKWLHGNTPYNCQTHILTPVRLWMSALTVLIDLLILSMSNMNSVLIYGSLTFGNLLFNTRSLANSMETMLFVLCLYLIAFKEKLFLKAILLGFVSAFGVFLRPTLVIFFIYPYLKHLKRTTRQFGFKASIITMALSLMSGLLTSLFLILKDTQAYKEELWSDEMRRHSSLIVAPLNFILYNANQSVISQEHGRHGMFTTLFYVFFLILNPLSSYQIFRKVKLDLVELAIPLTVFSLISHQEARFVMPLMPLLCMAISRGLPFKKHAFSFIWIIHNGVLFVLYGFLHQAGLISYLMSDQFSNGRGLLIFIKTYMPPKSFVNGAFKIIDLKGSMESLDATLLQNQASFQNATIISPCINNIPGARVVERIFPNLNTEIFDMLVQGTHLVDFLSLCIYKKPF